MAPVWTKLNLKTQREITVLNAPESFESEIDVLAGVAVHRELDSEAIEFVLAFVTKQAEVDDTTRALAPRLQGDAIVWFAYPKGSSKRYRCEFNRDNGWNVLGDAGMEPVRQVAIDDDWSALRFRRVEYVKQMTRDGSRAMTAQGRERVKKS